eukprot:scaffold3399_cov117-Cylindrotheca_fusiformis.AAC.1
MQWQSSCYHFRQHLIAMTADTKTLGHRSNHNLETYLNNNELWATFFHNNSGVGNVNRNTTELSTNKIWLFSGWCVVT